MRRIAICGLDCASCEAYIATKKDDNRLRAKVAEKWSREFGYPDLKLEDISCLGCLSLKEPLFQHCKECKVRKCALTRGLKNCGQCSDYPCKKIKSLHKETTGGKEICDEIHHYRNSL